MADKKKDKKSKGDKLKITKKEQEAHQKKNAKTMDKLTGKKKLGSKLLARKKLLDSI